MGFAEGRGGFVARAGAGIDFGPTVGREFHFVEEGFAAGEDEAFRVVSVIHQPVAAFFVFDDAAVAGTFPVVVAGEDRVGRIFFPGAEQGFGARDAEGVVAIHAAAAVAGIEEIKVVVAADDERAFDDGAFPCDVVAKKFFGFAEKFCAGFVEALGPEDAGFALAIAVFFPDEIRVVFFVAENDGIDGAHWLRNERAVIGGGALWFIGTGEGVGGGP